MVVASLKELKQQLIEEINSLGIEGLIVNKLNLLTGSYVNLEYPLSNGTIVKFLKEYDDTNMFYLSLGFKELEVFPTLWDENNPRQIYVMAI